MSWEHQGNYRVAITITTAWRYSYYYNATRLPQAGHTLDLEGGKTLNFGDGTTQLIYPTVTSWDIAGDAILATTTVVHQYPGPNNNGTAWLAFWAWYSRLNSLRNVGGGSWNLQTSIDLANYQISPKSGQLPIVAVTTSAQQPVASIPVAAAYDNGAVTFRLGTTCELCRNCNCSQPRQMTIDRNTGVLRWNTTQIGLGVWCVVVMIETATTPSIKIPVDFILNYTRVQGYCNSGCDTNKYPNCTTNQDCGRLCGVGQCVQQQKPIFVAPTPPQNVTITAEAGKTLAFNVSAWSADGTAVNVVINPGSTFPSGAGFVGAAVGSNPVTRVVTWNPDSSQLGNNLICFSAYSQLKSPSNPTRVFSEPYCITINVIECTATCQNMNQFCGNISNGCGGILNCGPPCEFYTIITNNTWALTTTGRAPGALVVIDRFDTLNGPTERQRWLISGNTIISAWNQNLLLAYHSTTMQLQLVDITQLSATQISEYYWTFPAGPDGQMYIAQTGNNRVMDIYFSVKVPGSPIILYFPKQIQHAQNQLWITDNTTTPGAVGIRVLHSGFYISVNGSIAHGTELASNVGNKSALLNTQKWIIRGAHILLAANTNFAIGYGPRVPTYGFRLQLVDLRLLSATQLNTYLWEWVLVKSPSWHFIYNSPGAPCATVNGPYAPGSPVHVETKLHPSVQHQLWKVERWGS